MFGLIYGFDYGWQYWTVYRFEESTDDAYVKAESTIVAPKISGYLRTVLVKDNEVVKAGQPLAQIDDRDFQIAVSQADADLAGSQAAIGSTKASLEQQRALIEQARATVSLDAANLIFAQQDNDRYMTLAKGGAGSLQNAQQALSRLNVAKATRDRDEAAVSAAQKQLDVMRAQLMRANADAVRAAAVLKQAQLNLSYTMITAPVDGTVGNRTLRVGQFVQAGTGLMSIVPLDAVYVVANFKETQLTDVRPGQAVTIDVDSFPDHAVAGTVDSLAPTSGQEFALLPPDNATGNFTKVVQRIPVKITLSGKTPFAGLLRPGMSVVPTINTKPAQSSD